MVTLRVLPDSLIRRSIVLAVLALATPSPLCAQQAVAPVTVVPPTMVKLTSPWLSDLRQIYRTGDSRRLATTALDMLMDLQGSEISSECCNAAEQYFLVIFVAPDPTAATGSTVVTTLVHAPMSDTPALPGLTGATHPLYEVFLAEDTSASIQGTYTIAHEENPALKQAADLASLIVTKLALPAALKTAAGTRAGAPLLPSDRPYQHAVTINKVAFPEPGKLSVRQVIRYDDPLMHVTGAADYLNTANRHDYEVQYQSTQPGPPCAAFSDLLKKQVDTVAKEPSCAPWPIDPAECAKKIAGGLNSTLASYLKSPPAPACPAAEAASLTQDFTRATEFKPVTATTSLGNARLVRFGFGLAAAYVARVRTDNDHPRVQMQSGKIAVDPFPRLMSMGVVYLTPWGYDAQTFSPATRERFRFFAGAAFTPYFGATGGAAWELNRYLSVAAGYARVWFDTPKPGESVDAAPTASNKAEPFELRNTGACFVAIAYNLK